MIYLKGLSQWSVSHPVEAFVLNHGRNFQTVNVGFRGVALWEPDHTDGFRHVLDCAMLW